MAEILTEEQKKHSIELAQSGHKDKMFEYLIDITFKKDCSKEERQLYTRGFVKGYLSCISVAEHIISQIGGNHSE